MHSSTAHAGPFVGAATAILVVLAAHVGTASAQAHLYDIDFATPPHEPDRPPAVGDGPSPRATVSRIAFGSPTVVAGFGALDRQPCRFDTYAAGGTQFELTLDDLPPSAAYDLSCRIVIEDVHPGDGFTIFLDSPAVRSLSFTGGGAITVKPLGEDAIMVGTYALDEVLAVRIAVDLAADRWRIEVNEAVLHVGSFGGAVAIDGVRFSSAIGGSAGLIAAIDDIVIAGGSQPRAFCEKLDLDDLPAGAFYGAGDVFYTGGAAVTLAPAHLNTGVCGEPTTGNFARVATDGLACGDGQELVLVNMNLVFDFGGPVRDVVIPFAESGGIINLAVNDDCRALPEFSLLDGVVLGGVRVEVIYRGLPGAGCGSLVLHGEVERLAVGGQNLALDGIGYCRAGTDVAEADFEDLVPGTTWQVGDRFASGFAAFEVLPFNTVAGCHYPVDDGTVAVGAGGNACGDGRELAFDRVNLALSAPAGAPYAWLVLDYGDLDGRIDLQINGDCRNVEDFASYDGTSLGGVALAVIDHEGRSGGCGRLYAVGEIATLRIGGAALWLDDLRVGALQPIPSGVSGLPRQAGAMLAQNAPNPFNPSTTVRFELARAGRAELAVFDLAGRRVATLVDAELGAGEHAARWDGRDTRGRGVASGVYLCRLVAGEAVATRRMVLLR
ncbi:MAG: T9SS type A sorting domain-containing protein [Krumholzibacteria bacterium]|nr:T9SS type A sorting domain-containing protein [Candidatus Krumholzibacteria bacterium]